MQTLLLLPIDSLLYLIYGNTWPSPSQASSVCLSLSSFPAFLHLFFRTKIFQWSKTSHMNSSNLGSATLFLSHQVAMWLSQQFHLFVRNTYTCNSCTEEIPKHWNRLLLRFHNHFKIFIDSNNRSWIWNIDKLKAVCKTNENTIVMGRLRNKAKNPSVLMMIFARRLDVN